MCCGAAMYGALIELAERIAMEPQRCTIDGQPGTVKRQRLRDDGSMVAHVKMDDGSLLIVPLESVTGPAKKVKPDAETPRDD